jgi:hypothetical protein
MKSNNDDEDSDDYPPLEDADIEDVSSGASVVSDSSESISVDSETSAQRRLHQQQNPDHSGELVINRFNKLMDDEIDEGDREDDEDVDDDDEGFSDEELPDESDNNNEMIGDYKRRRGSLDNVSDDQSFGPGFGEPIIVPLKTCSDDEGGTLVDSPKKPHGRRLSRTKMEALNRNMIRRQSSNEMLQAMQQATKKVSPSYDDGGDDDGDNHKDQPRRKPPPRTKSGDGFQRRLPPRTKSGENMNGSAGGSDDGFQRRPPVRTKSGESGGGFERRPPPRSKSGEGAIPSGMNGVAASASRLQRARDSRIAMEAAAIAATDDDNDKLGTINNKTGRRRESRKALEVGSEYETQLPDDDGSDAIMMSPSGRPRRRGVDKEMALKRNAARRQKSSDMLGAMRAATRNIPVRSQSSTAAFERRPPDRTKSSGPFSGSGSDDDDADESAGGDGGSGGLGLAAMTMSVPGGPSRRPPSRTKSGDGFAGRRLPSLEGLDGGDGGGVRPIRRAPARTKSGSVFKPMKEDDGDDS